MPHRSPSYDESPYVPSYRVLITVTVTLWLAIALFNTGIFVFNYDENGPLYEFFYGIRWTPLYHSPWLLIIPCVLWLARKFPLHREMSLKHISIHLTLAVGIAFLTSLLHTVFIYIRLGEPFQFSSVPGNFLFYSIDRILIYFMIAAGYYAVDYYRKMNQESIKELRLAESINRQNLNSFKHDIQPGFLLNTIRDIERILPHNPDLAEKMIADFAQIIRKMLQNSQKSAIKTDDDLQFLTCYIDILAARLGKDIAIRESLAAPDKRRDAAASLFVIRVIEELISRNPGILQNLEKITYEPFISGTQHGIHISLNKLNVASEELQKWFSGIFIENKFFHNNNKNNIPETVRLSKEGTLFLCMVSPASEL